MSWTSIHDFFLMKWFDILLASMSMFCVCACSGQKKVSKLLELRVQAVVS